VPPVALVAAAADSNRDAEGSIAIGKLRGEDYNFEFHGKVKDGKMHFRLHMTQVRLAPLRTVAMRCMEDCVRAADQQLASTSSMSSL
jgi:hypothetical protein